jgi:steroid delta-isomerase-like uncharacterized protein
MATGVETVRTWSDRFNSRDWDDWLSLISPDCEFVDLAQGVIAKGYDGMLAYGKGWVDAFSDGAYTEHRLRPADGAVIFQFLAVGTNDGPFGSFPASGKRVAFPGMDVIELNDEGQISRVEQLYDRLDILTQLDHISPS